MPVELAEERHFQQLLFQDAHIQWWASNIVDSTFQYNTARKSGGGLNIGLAVPSEYFCCSADVNITNVYGGGLTLLDNSFMYLRPNTHIMFFHNHATYAGGAIYVQSDKYDTYNPNCFYQFDVVNQTISELNIQILFANNTASFAGSALYGGFVDFCFLILMSCYRGTKK